MYGLARLLTMLGVLVSIYCVAVIVALGWPGSAAVLGILALGYVIRRGRGPLTTLGSARWASEEDLRRAGMLDADSGMIIGRSQGLGASGLGTRVRRLFDRRVSAKNACRAMWYRLNRGHAQIVRLSQAIHTVVFAPSGAGKGVSMIIPWLLTSPAACVVTDFKGELAMLTAEHRRKRFGHQIVLLDPFKLVTQTPDTFNPLDFIDKDSRVALDECNNLAKALVVRSPDEREPHFNDSSERWIAAVTATVVHYGEEDTRSLQMVTNILSHPEKVDTAIKLMCESDSWDGMLARAGGRLLQCPEKERGSVMTTNHRHLSFLDTLAIAASTKSSTFDPGKLRTGKMTVYLILPPEHMRAQSPLLRMWIGSLLRAAIRGGVQE